MNPQILPFPAQLALGLAGQLALWLIWGKADLLEIGLALGLLWALVFGFALHFMRYRRLRRMCRFD